jgi:hypothetical protein
LEKHVLSKSTFLRSVQCQKSLYLYKNFIQLRDAPSAEQSAIFSRGSNVGILAQQLYKGGVDATPSKSYDYIAAVNNTQELINSGVEIIYEAAFQYEGVLAILDILVKKNNEWYAYEVKSSTKISQTYLLDASLQYWVINQSEVVLKDFSIITINNQYERKGALELEKLFVSNSVLKDVLKNKIFVEEKITQAKNTIADARMPDIKIGTHCFSPYTCDFKNTCWKNVPSNSVFEITGISKEEQFNLYNNGIETIDAIPERNELNAAANLHIATSKNASSKVDHKKLKHFLDNLKYPLYFIDFEIFMPAVPLFDGTKPYQHLPFQFSIHYKNDKDSKAQHFEFLAEQGSDTRKQFVEAFLKQTQNNGTILAYDTLMEKNILNKLKLDFPLLANDLSERVNRIKDLAEPFQQKWFYHPAMKNSFSIKNVLHAMVPDLSYSNLKIQSGSIAMIAFESLQKETDLFKIIETREALSEYCKLDTLAMLRVFELLEKAIEE